MSLGAGSDHLLKDLVAVVTWSDIWQLLFNTDKCKILHISSSNPGHSYSMQGRELEVASIERDLSIHIDPELKFCKHAASAAAKGKQMLALVKWPFICISTTTLPLLYKTLVHPHIEHANLIWGPFNRADQMLIEHVQRRATKLVSQLRNLPCQERLRLH